MKITAKLILVILLFATCTNDEQIESNSCGGSQYTCIPDSNFEQALIDLGIDSDGLNGRVLTSEISGVTELIIGARKINDLTGIERFTSLTILKCGGNQLTSVDISNNTSLTFLECYNNQLTSLDLGNNTSLERLLCRSNQLTSLDISNNTSLSSLYCQDNPLTCIKVNQTQFDNIPTDWIKDSDDTYSLDCK